ncbi:hypothetical protein ASPVEDRAFT_81401 [Aspergillus versicolor CBS 583.65]|uniref:HNH domain-containing protein n=1 Tax=Aspergillus versicolor CBS 583.65 TaxID=1036611 RepID=A0A1L9PE71_ASPVE|nr:uncharacterized protein ASPVEDRAFT_81401 [Aspergillus versicolor CBS 583.65]OJI99810.1 hypothetical protein ASPVEDRAFT_81401 [Aspergillus versicolor CBS 583.65]
MTTNERCFMCGHRGQQGAHLVEESDESVRILKAKGLINFRLVSVENGVALCARCHIEYDDHCDPKLMFYPYGFGPENNYGLDGFDSYYNEGKTGFDPVAKGGEDDDGGITEREGTDLESMDAPLVFNIQRWRWEIGPESSSDDKARELAGSFM